MPCCSLQVLIQAVQPIVETIISVCDQESPLLIYFFTHLTPGQTEWTRIRQALPPQVNTHGVYTRIMRNITKIAHKDLNVIGLQSSLPHEMIFSVDHFLLSLQWVKMPLLSNRYRGLCEQSSVDMWKFRVSTRLPAHLCACALLGKVAQLSAFPPCEQKNAENLSQLQNLKTTGENFTHLFIIRSKSL